MKTAGWWADRSWAVRYAGCAVELSFRRVSPVAVVTVVTVVCPASTEFWDNRMIASRLNTALAEVMLAADPSADIDPGQGLGLNCRESEIGAGDRWVPGGKITWVSRRQVSPTAAAAAVKLFDELEGVAVWRWRDG